MLCGDSKFGAHDAFISFLLQIVELQSKGLSAFGHSAHQCANFIDWDILSILIP